MSGRNRALSGDRSDRWLAGVIGGVSDMPHIAARRVQGVACRRAFRLYRHTPTVPGGSPTPRQHRCTQIDRVDNPRRIAEYHQTAQGMIPVRLRAAPRVRKRGVADAHRRLGAGKAASDMVTLMSTSSQWLLGIGVGVVVIAVAAAIVITIVMLAQRIATQAKTSEGGGRGRARPDRRAQRHRADQRLRRPDPALGSRASEGGGGQMTCSHCPHTLLGDRAWDRPGRRADRRVPAPC